MILAKIKYENGTYIGDNGIFLIERTKKTTRGWNGIMQCHCGKIFESSIYAIANNTVKSCGCLAKTACFSKKFSIGELLGPHHVKLVRYLDKKDSSGQYLGEFECPFCGKHYVKRISRVASGEAAGDCGCQEPLRRKRVGEKNIKEDLVGKRFGRLVVLERTERTHRQKYGTYIWKCQCDCGNICYVSRNNLIAGNTQSCGCRAIDSIREIGRRNAKDLSGQVFGYLVPLYKDGIIERGTLKMHSITWACECLNCGRIVPNVSAADLVSGNRKYCGDCSISSGEEHLLHLISQIYPEIEHHKMFDTCINKNSGRRLIFDYYLPKEAVLVEYDGKQHYAPYGDWGVNFEAANARDVLKNEWCKENGIPLIRIPYTYLDELTPEFVMSLVTEAESTRRSIFLPLPEGEHDERPIKF